MEESIGYKEAGVDYDVLDAFKRLAQQQAAATGELLEASGFQEVKGIRGESAFLFEADDMYIAQVEEGLGTKNLLADSLEAMTGKSYYYQIGIDTVAAIVNDLVTSGAQPVTVALHAAVGDVAWFANQGRAEALVQGFAEGCRRAGAAWGGGETPVLRDVVHQEAIVLAGSAIGIVRPKERLVRGNVMPGDRIVFLASSGIHANGLTLCRTLAERLPDGLKTLLDDGRMFGEALMQESIIYAQLVRECLEAGIVPHYAVHVTGHGWRKLMRLNRHLVYRIENVGPSTPLYRFIQREARLADHEMYATFNMGVGFALFVENRQVEAIIDCAQRCNLHAWDAGHVADTGERKAVEILPLGVVYEADTMRLRT